MKRRMVLITGLAAVALLALATPAPAEDNAKSKEVTITGEGKCTKCIMKETDKCSNAIQTTEEGKTVTYYLAQNDVSKAFHEDLCEKAKKVTVTGTVKDVDGKKELTPTKIELAKE